MIESNVSGQKITFASPGMQRNFVSAVREINSTLGFPVKVSSSFRSEAQNKAAMEEGGFKGSGGKHLTAEALDLTFGIQSGFSKGSHTASQAAIERASIVAPILEKYGFKWLGEKDVVHFDYVGDSEESGNAQSDYHKDGTTRNYRNRDIKQPFFLTLGPEVGTFETVNKLFQATPSNSSILKEKLHAIAMKNNNFGGKAKFYVEPEPSLDTGA